MDTALQSELRQALGGRAAFDRATRLLYATDASVYRVVPRGVLFPADEAEVEAAARICARHGAPLICRGAGTSLAGQTVGDGVVMDFSRHFDQILEINPAGRWARVRPGAVLDKLNAAAAAHGLTFGPETSTASRCTLGGMAGNNSCGSHSLAHKSTREHLLEARVVLADGTPARFGPLTPGQLAAKRGLPGAEGDLYRQLHTLLDDPANRRALEQGCPAKGVYRRNTGYAVDLLAQSAPYDPAGPAFNLCQLLAGSEGTLAIAVELKVNLVPLPPPFAGLVVTALPALDDAFRANLVALRHGPSAVELMDRHILEAAGRNPAQARNRALIQGDPAAVLITELNRGTRDELRAAAQGLIDDLEAHGHGASHTLLEGDDMRRIWELRKAGLGVLTNVAGDAKPVTVVEDTCVAVELLPGYIADFRRSLADRGLECVYHAHIGSGEIHLRPVLNLKDPADRARFRDIGQEIARLVRRYRGSLSGEHGDGRLRAEFAPIVLGQECARLMERVKDIFDPAGLLNPGKVVRPAPMDTDLRYAPGQATPDIATHFDFARQQGLARAVEACNGSADCRRREPWQGRMCPTFMATLDERDSTRGRANALREHITHTDLRDPLASRELYQALDTCLACKACKSECPSNVDMAKIKSEFLQHYHDAHGVDLRSQLFGGIDNLLRLMSIAPGLANAATTWRPLASLLKKMTRVAPQRDLPRVASRRQARELRQARRQAASQAAAGQGQKSVYLFVDEFTRHTEPALAVIAIRLLTRLGYRVMTVRHPQSGRSLISKGMLRRAARVARRQVELFAPLANAATPLVGIEPSALLSFRDEYPDLLRGDLQRRARELAANCLLIDEFVAREARRGEITAAAFTQAPATVLLHTHCQQKAVADASATAAMLRLPANYTVREVKAGCCGMAGSFGYEREHYALSMRVGELALFPAVRAAEAGAIVAANGTSCRQQILDGTGTRALHPIEVLWRALAPAAAPAKPIK